MPRRRRWLALGAVFVLMLLALDQGLQLGPLADGHFAGRRVAPYDPPLFNAHHESLRRQLETHLAAEQRSALAFHHDGDLGWCPTPQGTIRDQHYDWAGARIGTRALAREKRAGVRRIVTVGCSFTLGSEVPDDQSWAAQLERARPDLELANLGVEGYGVDQALLRYRRDGRPLEPDEVWLGFLPSAALRATTLYRPAQMHFAQIGFFKPRFAVEADGSLRLVPNPGATLAATLHLLTHQADFVAALTPEDPWVQRFPVAWAPRGSSWLHRSGLARLGLTVLEARGHQPYPRLADPASDVVRVTRAIVLALQREAAADGVRARLLVLPAREDLAHWHGSGRAVWLDLCDELARAGIEVIDLTPDFPAPGTPEYADLWAPGGHYSMAGNQLVAGILARRCE